MNNEKKAIEMNDEQLEQAAGGTGNIGVEEIRYCGQCGAETLHTIRSNVYTCTVCGNEGILTISPEALFAQHIGKQ